MEVPMGRIVDGDLSRTYERHFLAVAWAAIRIYLTVQVVALIFLLLLGLLMGALTMAFYDPSPAATTPTFRSTVVESPTPPPWSLECVGLYLTCQPPADRMVASDSSMERTFEVVSATWRYLNADYSEQEADLARLERTVGKKAFEEAQPTIEAMSQEDEGLAPGDDREDWMIVLAYVTAVGVPFRDIAYLHTTFDDGTTGDVLVLRTTRGDYVLSPNLAGTLDPVDGRFGHDWKQVVCDPT
jgi:hypothetical protein